MMRRHRHLDRAMAAGDVGAPLPGQQYAARRTRRAVQIAVFVVMAVEEAASALVERDVGIVGDWATICAAGAHAPRESKSTSSASTCAPSQSICILCAMPLRRAHTIERSCPASASQSERILRAQLPSQRRWPDPCATVVAVDVLHPQNQSRKIRCPTSVSTRCPAERRAGRGAISEPTAQPKPTIHLPQQQTTRGRGMSPPSKPATTARAALPLQIRTVNDIFFVCIGDHRWT